MICRDSWLKNSGGKWCNFRPMIKTYLAKGDIRGDMGILFKFFQQVRLWDAPTKAAFAMAIVLLVVVMGILANAPNETVRNQALLGATGLVIGLQVIAMWGNRHMVTAYTQAQRQFMRGDFAAARDTLLADMDEKQAAGKKASVDTYILLGNTYRQLGDLNQSEEVLTKALQMRPTYHFALYGFGRTLLSKGDYQGAIRAIEQAIQYGAPPVVQFDLGHAQYRAGQTDIARQTLEAVNSDEAHRQLMTRYMLHRLQAAEPPDAGMIQAGLPFWQAEIERFAQTPYGQALQHDMRNLESHWEVI